MKAHGLLRCDAAFAILPVFVIRAIALVRVSRRRNCRLTNQPPLIIISGVWAQITEQIPGGLP